MLLCLSVLGCLSFYGLGFFVCIVLDFSVVVVNRLLQICNEYTTVLLFETSLTNLNVHFRLHLYA